MSVIKGNVCVILYSEIVHQCQNSGAKWLLLYVQINVSTFYLLDFFFLGFSADKYGIFHGQILQKSRVCPSTDLMP